MSSNNLVLIPGVTGRMGEEFQKKFSSEGSFDVIGFTSNRDKVNDVTLYTDFLDVGNVSTVVSNIELDKYENIYLIHCIGPFKFEESGLPEEDYDNDGISDEIYKLNFLTFKNINDILIKRLSPEQRLILCAFGSISDSFNIPFWQSYSKSKKVLREYMLGSISASVRGVFVNVSSTEKEEERPYADKTYWLSCKEVADRSFESITNDKLNWQEISIIKPNPNYTDNYFKDLDKIKQSWLEQLYGDER